jgi:DNA-binding NtrC family response regulator
MLAAHFLEKYVRENQSRVTGFSPEALDYLNAYDWPGNVRQLQNVIERCTVLAAGTTIGVDDLPPEVRDEESQFKSAVDLLPARLNLADTWRRSRPPCCAAPWRATTSSRSRPPRPWASPSPCCSTSSRNTTCRDTLRALAVAGGSGLVIG